MLTIAGGILLAVVVLALWGPVLEWVGSVGKLQFVLLSIGALVLVAVVGLLAT